MPALEVPFTGSDRLAPIAAAPALTVDALIDPRPLSTLQWRVIALCGLATFLDGYDIAALGLSIPKMAAEFGVAPTAFTAALSGSLIGMALGAMLLSPLADRLGRRPMMITMLLLIGVTTAGAAQAGSPVEMTVWRVLSGLGLGALAPVAITMTSEYAPARRRAALITLMVCGTSVGAFAAGFIAPVVEARWGWRGIFGAGAVAPLAAMVLCLVALPESLRVLVSRRGPATAIDAQVARIAPDLRGVLLHPDSARTASKVGVQALFSPSLWQRTALLWTLFWLNLFVNYALISWLPSLLSQAGWEHALALRTSGILAIGGIVGGLLISAAADRGRAVGALLSAYAVTAAALALLVVFPEVKAFWTGALAVAGLGSFGAQIAIGSMAAMSYPMSVRSTGVGWASGVGRSGSFVGPLFLASLMSAGLSPAPTIAALAVPLLLCAALVTLLPTALRA